MLSELFARRRRLQALQVRPQAELVERFGRHLVQAGYVVQIARRYVRAAEHLIDWVDRRHLLPETLDDAAVGQFARHIRRCGCREYGPVKPATVLPGARIFLNYLRHAGVVATPGTPPAPQDPALLIAFGQWMRQQRGTSEVTLAKYRPDICRLLIRVHEDPKQIEAGLLRELVFEKHRTAGPSMVGICTHALRMFVRFLIATGRCASGLDAAIPTIAHWDLASLPRYVPPDEVERLLASSNRPSPLGRRNHAILLLLARLGLRAGEIVHLRLGDIDWKNASIRVCGKGHRLMRLPLTQEVGEALVAYVQQGRPHTPADALFVTSRAPFRALASASTVSCLVAEEMRRADVRRPSRGAAHLLRHSVATNLLRQGASLQDIQALLRHQSVKTTQIYAKVDVAALRHIAQPWPEVSSC
jgi:integrase/recombinase XerD